MTLPFERTFSVIQTREFLLSLLDSKATPRVPKPIRLQARSLLRHFPTVYDMKQVAKLSPHIFTDKK